VNREEKRYAPPRIWPGILEMEKQQPGLEDYPFPYLIKSGGKLLGLFFGLDDSGVKQIADLLETNPNLYCKLIIGVYPTCTSGDQELEEMLALQNNFPDQVEFRLYTINNLRSGASSSLMFIDESGENTVLVTGSLLGFNSLPLKSNRSSFVFRPETTLIRDWIYWFNYIWVKYAIPLNSFTARIPPLVPIEATEEAINMWEDYLQTCQQSLEYQVVKVEIDPETGEMVVINEDGEELALPSTELNIPQISPLADRLSRLYSAGKLVSFNKLSRIPPIDCPAQAEWFGLDSLRTVGTVTREVKYRISALEPEALRKFNNFKTNGATLLRRLGFSLGDGLHWMPDAMIVLLQNELNRITDDALALIYNSMGIRTRHIPGTDRRKEMIRVFIKQRQEKIVGDANRIYEEFFPGEKMEQQVIDIITGELEFRLEKVLTGKVFPDVLQNSIAFSFSPGADQSVLFDQPFLLLKDLALFPRMILSEDYYFLRGIRIDSDELLEAVDVCNDQIIAAAGQPDVKNRAHKELSLLKEIINAEVYSEVKCRAIFAVMDGVPEDKVKEIINEGLVSG
jgi:hypothetical protein